MRGKVVGLVAGAALLASVGIANANAKGPVQLTDAQLDKITAGDSASSILTSSTQLLNTLVATSTNTVVALSAFTNNTLNFYNAFLTFTP
jgi:purine-cytosine permease-like protein